MPTISLSGYDSYPISSGEEDCYIISNDNILFHISKIEDAYVKEKVLEDVVGVFGGVYAITSDNSLWAWGDNEIFEAKGISVTDKPIKVMNDVKYVQRNGRTTFIIKTDNTLWGIGLENTFPGTFKTDDTSFKKLMNNILNVQLGDLDAWVLKTDNSVWSLSSGKIMRNVKNLFSGMDAFYAVNDNDELWRWGTLYGGLIGRDESDKDYPEKYIERAKCVSPHYGYNLVIRDDDTLWLYGKGYPDDGTVINQKWLTLNNLNMPIKIMDDVNSLSGLTHRNNNRVLILNNSGEVYEFSLFQNAENEQVDFSISKITDNVKLAQEFVANKSKDFEDIQDMSDEAKDSIRSLATAGIIEGNENGDFLPNETISRAEAIKSLLKIVGIDKDCADVRFTDVDEGDWYYSIVVNADNYGIVTGFPDNTFRGDEKITGIQLATLALRVLYKEEERTIEDKNMKLYHDFPEELPKWAEYEISLARINKLITLEDCKKFANNEEITRAEAAVILYRLYQAI